MEISKKGLDLIKSFEGCKLVGYLCPAGIPTIGYGHTGKGVTVGMKITKAQAEQLLVFDLEKFEKSVNNAVKVKLTQCQFDALVSFTYNVGAGNLVKSTLLKKVNAKDFIGASNEFKKWNKGGGKVLAGLTRRREAEKKLFML